MQHFTHEHIPQTLPILIYLIFGKHNFEGQSATVNVFARLVRPMAARLYDTQVVCLVAFKGFTRKGLGAG